MVKNNSIKSSSKENKRFSHYNFSSKNKKGWIKLVEVFISILLLSGVLLVFLSKNSTNREDFQEQMIKRETAILRDIELNDTLRAEVLNVNSATLPLEWNSFGAGLADVQNRITYLAPKDFECQAKICLINQLCTVSGTSGKEVYAQTIIIAANSDVYSPRQLKLFCEG